MKIFSKYEFSFLTFFFLVCFQEICAQVEATMPFMKSLPQITYYNPAFKPEYKFSIGLPGSSVFAQLSNNGFTYNDFISKQNSILTADLDKLYSSLRNKNYINANLNADLFRISVKANARLYFTFNVSAKAYSRIMLPKDLAGLFIKGTDPYVNGTAKLSPKAEIIGYAEVGWGAAYTVNNKLTVGAKLKFLRGAINATSQSAQFDLSISENYALTVTGNADIRTSGIHNLEDDEYDPGKNWRDFMKNTGVAVDLGATYKLMEDRLTVGLSLIDLGGIHWKNDLYGYRLDPTKAKYTFEGIDIGEVLNGDDKYLESMADSVEANFKVNEGRIAAYRTPLPGKIYASGSYEIKKNLTAGALLFAEKFKGRFMPGFSISLNKELGRLVGTSLSYTITNNSFNNIGAGLSLNFIPVQIYIVGDNILRAPLSLATNKNLNPYLNSLQYFNLRVGLNFIFGRITTQEKQPHPKLLKSK
jgi:Family of unknown function (DUF5723)